LFMKKFLTTVLIVLITAGAGFASYLRFFVHKASIVSPVSSSEVLAEDTSQSSESTSTATPTASPTSTPTSTPTPTPTPTPAKEVEVTGTGSATGQVFYGRGTPNNKIGMYVNNIADDVKAAAKLVNSNGGDWGYVLLTMNIGDRDVSHWKDLFGAASKAHLSPIVQLSNNGVCNVDKMDFEGVAKTLDKAGWSGKHIYVSIFNEMNSKDYWCEKIAPDEYAKALDKAIKAFDKVDKKFFIMPGAFNSSARTQDRYLAEETYLSRMNQAVPGIFNKIDGWSTHSYPQPNFSGDPHNLPSWYGTRDTINNYTWEMSVLKSNFGINGLPIFITETGWLHKEGQSGCVQYSQNNLLSADTTANRFKDAYINYWLNDSRVVAITPFVFRSTDPCASGFAWQKKDGSWYPQATMLMNIPKTAGSN
jgi:hypothetical protein